MSRAAALRRSGGVQPLAGDVRGARTGDLQRGVVLLEVRTQAAHRFRSYLRATPARAEGPSHGRGGWGRTFVRPSRLAPTIVIT